MCFRASVHSCIRAFISRVIQKRAVSASAAEDRYSGGWLCADVSTAWGPRVARDKNLLAQSDAVGGAICWSE